MQRLSAITHARFGLFRVRSPLLTESRLFSFPVGTEMFHFPTFPPATLYIQVEVAGHYSGFFRGFPIRRSPDRSSFTSSPGLIAGYNVLHRLLMPRHPPIALSSLLFHYKDARVHCAVLKKRAGPGHTSRVARLSSGPHEEGCHSNRPFRTQQCALGHHSLDSRFHSAGEPDSCTDEPEGSDLVVNVPLRCLPRSSNIRR
jgi:hypothetical protein